MVNRKLREVLLTMQEENERDHELVLAFCRADYQKQLDKKLSALVQCVERQRNRATYTTSMASASSYSQPISGQMQRSSSVGGGSSSLNHKTPCAQRSNSIYTEAVAVTAPLSTKKMNRNNIYSSSSSCGRDDQMKNVIRRGDLTRDNIAQRSSTTTTTTSTSAAVAALLETMQTPATGQTITEHCNSTDSTTTATRRIDPTSQLPEWQRDVVTMTKEEEELTKANLVDVIHRLYRESTAVPNTWTPTLQQQQEQEEKEKEKEKEQQQEHHVRVPSTLMDHVSPERTSQLMSSLVRGVGGGTTTTTTATGTTTSSSAGGGMTAGRNVMSKEQVMAELRRLYGLEDAENGEKMDE